MWRVPSEARHRVEAPGLLLYRMTGFASLGERCRGLGALHLISETHIAPHAGFPPHPHHEMEIVSYVRSGTMTHRDSTGGGAAIGPGEVQRMSAGSGIVHSEFNASDTEPVHMFQIWLEPNRRGLSPGYEQRVFARDGRGRGLRLLASRDGRDDSLAMHCDGDIYGVTLAAGESVRHALGSGRAAYVQIAGGAIELNGVTLEAGDGAAVTDEPSLDLHAPIGAEVLLFDLKETA